MMLPHSLFFFRFLFREDINFWVLECFVRGVFIQRQQE